MDLLAYIVCLCAIARMNFICLKNVDMGNINHSSSIK